MVDERFSCWRPASIAATNSDRVTFRALAISFSAFQNASSRLTLVLWPERTIERLMTRDFIRHPPLAVVKSLHRNRKFVPHCGRPKSILGRCKNHTSQVATSAERDGSLPSRDRGTKAELVSQLSGFAAENFFNIVTEFKKRIDRH